MSEQVTAAGAERRRIEKEFRRRAEEIDHERYSPSNPAELFMRNERKRVAARMLQAARRFPQSGDKCLEVGCGAGGWLPDLLSWGLNQADLHGIDLDPDRIARAREALPAAEFRVDDASHLPYTDGAFKLVVVSTVFTSILDESVRTLVANEIVRVLAPHGTMLWYDFAYNNPRNQNVRGIKRNEIRRLFPELDGRIRSITLAPPLARAIVPRSWPLATLLEAIPVLRTHFMAVLTK